MHYKISSKALEKNDILFFKSMLQLVRMHLKATWQFEEDANIVLVDVEHSEGNIFWRTHAANRVLIAYAKENDRDARWFLQKPIRTQNLIALLNDITELGTAKKASVAVQQKVTPTTPTPTQSKPAEIKPVKSEKGKDELFSPDNYLLGLLQSTLQKAQPTQFRCAGLSPLYVLPSKQQCFSSAIDVHHINSSQKILYSAFIRHITVTALTEKFLQDIVKKQNLHTYPIETLLWATTLYASHGRFLKGFNSDSIVKLKRWPNFAVLPHETPHISLAAFMVKHTCDLKTVAAKTLIPLPTIIDFFNACKMIDLVIEEEQAKNVEEHRLPSSKRLLFKKILSRLLR